MPASAVIPDPASRNRSKDIGHRLIEWLMQSGTDKKD